MAMNPKSGLSVDGIITKTAPRPGLKDSTTQSIGMRSSSRHHTWSSEITIKPRNEGHDSAAAIIKALANRVEYRGPGIVAQA